MPEELENQEAQENQNSAPEPEDLDTIKAQLQAEQDALAEAQAALTEKDDRISDLETQLAQINSERELTLADLAAAREANEAAVTRYLDAVRLANPAIPGDAITGDTIEAIDAAAQRAAAIADRVKANLAAEARGARVPAGAPPRAVNLEGKTADELIRLGLTQEGGNQ